MSTIKIVYVVLLSCLFYPFNGFGNKIDTTGGCTVKNRWTIKTSISGYKEWLKSNAYFICGDYGYTTHKNRVNFRLEANYGFSKYLEIGIFLGFQDYSYIKNIPDSLVDEIGYDESNIKKTLAPIFGATLNFHLLPIFVKETRCRWDWYLSARYGGCVLPHVELEILDDYWGRYRQEYGLGMGLAYYFGNRAGLFAEFLFGRFSYFPNFITCTTNFRAGITCKI